MLALVLGFASLTILPFAVGIALVHVGKWQEQRAYASLRDATANVLDSTRATCMGRYPHGVLTSDAHDEGVPVTHEDWFTLEHVCAKHRVIEKVCPDSEHTQALEAWLAEQKRLKEIRSRSHKKRRF